MTGMRFGLVALAAAGALAVGATGAATGVESKGPGVVPASATKATAGGLRYKSADFTLPPMGEWGADVKCSDRTGVVQLTGGGVTVAGGTGEAYVFISHPYSRRGWFAELKSATGSPLAATTHEICARHVDPGDLELEYESRHNSGGFALKVDCPSNRAVTGGGGNPAVNDSAIVGFLNSSAPFDDGDRGSKPDDGWEIRGNILVPAHPRALASAVCAARDEPLGHVAYVHEKAKLGAAPSGGSVTARCGPHRVVTGGGVQVSGKASQAHINVTAPVDLDVDSTPDDGWVAWVHNRSGPEKKITAWAVCKHR